MSTFQPIHLDSLLLYLEANNVITSYLSAAFFAQSTNTIRVQGRLVSTSYDIALPRVNGLSYRAQPRHDKIQYKRRMHLRIGYAVTASITGWS